MTIKETRKLSMSELRMVCVENRYYTRGNNYDYDNLLGMVEDENYETKELTSDLVLALALDIAEHSEIEEMMLISGADYEECIAYICFNIIDKSYTTVEIQ